MLINFEKINNSKVLLRSDLNESIDEKGSLRSTKRVDAALATIQELVARKNKVIVISHHSKEGQSLAPLANYIRKTFADLYFIQSLDFKNIKEEIKNSDANIFLLENTRSFEGGADERNDQGFAKELASLAEYFVFDAFSVAHRSHSSTVGISELLPHTLGPIAQKEKSVLERVLNASGSQFVILGGAKLSTKLPLVESFLDKNFEVFLGGAMAHPILKAKGVDIKDSLTEDLDMSKIINNPNLFYPVDYVWNEGNTKIVDAGPDTLKIIKDKIINNKSILWNGPIGLYEDGYVTGTLEIINNLNNKQDKNVVVGGGDTLTVLEPHPDFKCSYISLSGGAMLEFLSGKKLPAIIANT